MVIYSQITFRSRFLQSASRIGKRLANSCVNQVLKCLRDETEYNNLFRDRTSRSRRLENKEWRISYESSWGIRFLRAERKSRIVSQIPAYSKPSWRNTLLAGKICGSTCEPRRSTQKTSKPLLQTPVASRLVRVANRKSIKVVRSLWRCANPRALEGRLTSGHLAINVSVRLWS